MVTTTQHLLAPGLRMGCSHTFRVPSDLALAYHGGDVCLKELNETTCTLSDSRPDHGPRGKKNYGNFLDP
jgi:hypothetical protein